MFNFKGVFYLIGQLLVCLATALTLPLLFAWRTNPDNTFIFFIPQIITAFTGFLLIFSMKDKTLKLNLRGILIALSLGWVVLGIFGALPFICASPEKPLSNVFFESISSLTTTGLSTFSTEESHRSGLFLWKATLSWMGGIGTILSSFALFPLLHISSQQLFHGAAPDTAKILPRAEHVVTYIICIYLGLTAFGICLLRSNGLEWNLSFFQAMSAISTTGFEIPAEQALSFYSLPIKTSLTLLMIFGSLPFPFYLRFARRDTSSLFHEDQIRAFLYVLLTSCVISIFLLMRQNKLTFLECLEQGIFKTISILSTTGIAINPESGSDPILSALFLTLAFIGGCAGSTAGGVHIFRIQVFFAMLWQKIKTLTTPHTKFQVMYNKQTLSFEIQNSICIFLLTYIFIMAIGTVCLIATGQGFETSITAALLSLTNSGSGASQDISSLPSLAHCNEKSLYILCGLMLLGRLEIFTILVLFSPSIWRR